MFAYVSISLSLSSYKKRLYTLYAHASKYVQIELICLQDGHEMSLHCGAKAKLLLIHSWALAIDPFLVSCATSIQWLPPPRPQHH